MASEQNHPWCRDVSRDAAIRAAEDAAAAERTPLPDHRDLPAAVAELRERVARLEAADATIGSGDVFRDVGCGSTGDEIVRLTEERNAARRDLDHANDEIDALKNYSEEDDATIARLTAERDAAREEAEKAKAECERLRDVVRQLSVKQFVRQHEAAPPANAGGEKPQPPRGWLTKNERAAVESARDYFAAPEHDDDECAFLAAALRSLLARSTPPKVKLPEAFVAVVEAYRDGVIAAIREAGGEVE